MAMLLAVMMLAGALPGAAWAEGTQTNERTVQAQEVESESRVQYQYLNTSYVKVQFIAKG